MPVLLLLAFVVVPLVELAVIVQVNAQIGLAWTLTLLVLDSAVGAWLVRREGGRAWQEFRSALERGRVPGDEIVNGVLLLFGGALMLTPGFVTDALGLALVLRWTRRPVARLVKLRFAPVPLQVGEAAWNRRRPGPADAEGPAAGPRRAAGPRPGHIEVLSVEREDRDAAGPDGVDGPEA